MHTLGIAASDAGDLARRAADFICDGENDDDMFSAAFSALPSCGGTIALSEGNFHLTESLMFPNKPLMLSGQGGHTCAGAQMTRLNFEFAADDDCVEFYADCLEQAVENLALVGDGSHTRYGILLNSGAAMKRARFVNVTEMTGCGIKGNSGNSQNYFERVLTRDLPSGFEMYGNANVYVACQAMRGSGAGTGGAQGFKVQETGAMYTACVAERYASGFVVTSYAQTCSLFSPYTEACDVSLVVSGDPAPAGCRIYGLSAINAEHDTLAAIRVLDSEGTLISAPFVSGSASGKSLEIGAGAVTLMVRGGCLDDETPYTCQQGATARIEDVSAQGQWLDWTST